MKGGDLDAATEPPAKGVDGDAASPASAPACERPRTLRQRTRSLYTKSKWRYAAWTGSALCCCLFLLIVVGVPVVLHERPWVGDAPGFIGCDGATTPFVCVDHLLELMAAGNVTLLDARPPPTQWTHPSLSRSIPGARRAQWQEFMAADAIMEPAAMAAVFRQKGVRNDRPVVVYGGWNAEFHWGEEGRIWWQLHWLDHPSVHILHGGVWAWDGAIHKGAAVEDGPGDFVPSPVASRIVRLEDLVQDIRTAPESVFIVDARQKDEFEGAAPYGSEYGGRVPGSVSYPWRGAFDASNELRPRAAIRAELAALGYHDGVALVTYCTRGVRSAFLTAILTWAGYDVGNYVGSWKDWTEHVSEKETQDLELVTNISQE